jgi:hypothetical protein
VSYCIDHDFESWLFFYVSRKDSDTCESGLLLKNEFFWWELNEFFWWELIQTAKVLAWLYDVFTMSSSVTLCTSVSFSPLFLQKLQSNVFHNAYYKTVTATGREKKSCSQFFGKIYTIY